MDPDTNWLAGQLHEDDISCLKHCPPTWFATGGCDGQIFLWNYQTQRLFLKLKPVNMVTGKLTAINQSVAPVASTVPPTAGTTATIANPSRAKTGLERQQMKIASPIDCLCFLPERYKNHRDSAVLISSEDGNLYWWSLWTQQHLFCWFTGVSYPEDYIVAICSDPEDNHLICGDTDGNILIWNISDYALRPTGEVSTLAPTRIAMWKAHDKAICEIKLVPRGSKYFIISASHDRKVLLWSSEGLLVGMFGHGKPWDLRDRHTWLISADEMSSRRSSLSEHDEVGEFSEKAKRKSSRVGFRLVDHENADTSGHQGVVPSSGKAKQGSRRGTMAGHQRKPILNIGKETNLGQKFSKNLERIKKDREERRNFMGDIEKEKMKKYGTGASAFQALVVADVGDTELPPDLPLLPGMKQRGISQMTEESLRKLNFKNSYVSSMFDLS